MTTDWMAALTKQKLEVRSARDGLATKGFLDTGSYALNWCVSGRLLGGLPLGHTVEVFGDPSTGKSFLAARVIAMAQAVGGVALLDDSEGAYNLEHVGNLGVDADRLAYRRSRTVREHLETARAFVQAYRALKLEVPGVLVCDSLSLLSTDHELEVGLTKRDMSKAAELKAFFRIVGGEFSDLPVVHVSTSHVIANIGDLFNKRTTAGGGGPKFQASVRIDLRSVSKIKQGTEYVGVICRAVVDKNRIVAPWKECRLAIPFHQPISRVSGLIPLLLDRGVLGLSGNYLTYQDKDLGKILAHKTKDSFLKQDDAAEALLDAVPELLEEADAVIGTVRTGEQEEVDPAVAVGTEEDDPEEVEA